MHVLCRKWLVFFLYTLRAVKYSYINFSTGICRNLFLYTPQCKQIYIFWYDNTFWCNKVRLVQCPFPYSNEMNIQFERSNYGISVSMSNRIVNGNIKILINDLGLGRDWLTYTEHINNNPLLFSNQHLIRNEGSKLKI